MRDVRLGVVIIDAHTDMVLELLVGEGEEPSLELILRQGRDRLLERYWLPRLEAGGVGIQICPLYGACAPGDGARGRALAQEAELRRAVEENAERLCLVRTVADLADPRLRLVLSMEGVEPLEGDPGAFEDWYERGVRSASLTWNHPNEFAGGIETPMHGLTRRGRALVRRSASSASSSTWPTHPSRPGATYSMRSCPSRSPTGPAVPCTTIRVISPTGSSTRSPSAEGCSG